MKENADNITDLKKSESSDISSNMFNDIPDNDPNMIIQRTTTRFSTIIDTINNINPLRDVHNENKFAHKSTKKKAIMESVVNLKIQYILYKVRDFIRKKQIDSNPNFSTKGHKTLRFLRNIALFIYGIIMFFERPWFCYDKSTVPIPEYFNFTNFKEEDTAFFGIPFINNYALRGIEIFLTSIIIITQFLKIKNEYFLKDSKLISHKNYFKMQIALFVFLFICLGDLIAGVSTNSFPILNFICRSFIYVYMIKRIRRNIIRIGKVLWRTKTIFFLLFLNIILFAFIGYFLFQKSDYFANPIQGILQLYILLSTCNFPDIMLDTFKVSKLSVFFFVIYVSTNFFILLSYLKTLYYTKYYQINKEDCLNIIKDIIENDYNKDILKLKEFEKYILKQKHLYYLDDKEFSNLLIILEIYNPDTELFNEVNQMIEATAEKMLIKNSFYGIYLLKSMPLEICVNVICIFFMIVIVFYDNLIILIFQFVWSLFLLFELFFLLKNLGIKRTIFHHFNRVIFQFFNLVVIGCLLAIFILDLESEDEWYIFLLKILKIFLGLRTIRIFVFLDKFKMIKNIYKIISISKEMFYRNLFTLYSLFLLFSTFSILLTGGTIKKGAFDDINDPSIPENYEYINFNDFPSAFVTCFSLLMINNLQIIVKSLTFYVELNQVTLEFYFATFYFFSTLIIVNIIQTLLLELYLISDFSDKKEMGSLNSSEIKEENKTN